MVTDDTSPAAFDRSANREEIAVTAVQYKRQALMGDAEQSRRSHELSKLIHTRSGGQLTFHIDSLYPLEAAGQARHPRG